MKRLKYFLNRVYRLTINLDKQENLVWKDLKKIHSKAGWRSGVYESEKYIEAIFQISEESNEAYYYMIYNGYYQCRVRVLRNYPIELTSEIFILATHFNNILSRGSIIVNVNDGYVEYMEKKELLIPLLYTGELLQQINQHYTTSKDIYSAFQRLIEENEAPAIIIADLISKLNEEDKHENT
jgi:hypothetical protein